MGTVMPTMTSLQELESLDVKSSKTETTAYAVIKSIKIRVGGVKALWMMWRSAAALASA
jgi:hypothetical protein